MPIGSFDDGQPVLVPRSQASVLIAGDTGAGQSYLAGLLAERWIDAGYAVLILDPDGDHAGLTRRPGVHLAAAAAHLPGPAGLLATARTGRASLVLDLSGLPDDSKSAYLNRLPDAVAAQRAQPGIPHWVITDRSAPDPARQRRPAARTRLCRAGHPHHHMAAGHHARRPRHGRLRPPSGLGDPQVQAQLRVRGLAELYWDIDPSGYQRPGAAVIARRVLAALHPGASVIMHDGGGNRSQTVAALPAIIRGIRAAGYQIVPACAG